MLTCNVDFDPLMPQGAKVARYRTLLKKRVIQFRHFVIVKLNFDASCIELRDKIGNNACTCVSSKEFLCCC